MKRFEFSDGLVLFPGEILATGQGSVHMDPNIYADPTEFDGFRFSRLRDEGESSKAYTTNTSTEFLTFGHGKHAWYNTPGRGWLNISPGRFFAINEIKVVLAFLLLRYDFKVDGIRPPNSEDRGQTVPDYTGKVLFRRRQ